ncbi:MAG: helix-turn-helix transcriptional regulator [Clostridia bacterium]|nr:helix-turn-helix transcriptional regulator [Clostridia bacterium]
MRQDILQSSPPIKNMQTKQAFGAYIKRHRKAKRLTQQGVADFLGISKKSVCYFEKGLTFPSQENIFALAKLLDMSLDEFVFGEIIFDHQICITEINELLLTLSDKEKGMAIKMLESIVDTIIMGRQS